MAKETWKAASPAVTSVATALLRTTLITIFHHTDSRLTEDYYFTSFRIPEYPMHKRKVDRERWVEERKERERMTSKRNPSLSSFILDRENTPWHDAFPRLCDSKAMTLFTAASVIHFPPPFSSIPYPLRTHLRQGYICSPFFIFFKKKKIFEKKKKTM